MRMEQNNLNIKIELTVDVGANPEFLETWVERIAKIQKEYNCHCTLFVRQKNMML